MINLASRNCMGPFVYNEEMCDYLIANGKPITDVPTERDSNNSLVSPIIALVHKPTRKVSAYRNWFYEGPKGKLRVHTYGGSIPVNSNNKDFIYMLIHDDEIEKLVNPRIIYDKALSEGIGVFTNFKTKEIDDEYLADKDKFRMGYTKKELNSKWYKKIIKLIK